METANGRREIPRIVSADDHAVEPPDLWWERLPTALRERGPRVVRMPYEEVAKGSGAFVRPAATGPRPTSGSTTTTRSTFHRSSRASGTRSRSCTPAPIAYADMRPGCYDPRRASPTWISTTPSDRCASRTYPRFAARLFLEAHGQGPRACCASRAYNDWMIDEWCGDIGRPPASRCASSRCGTRELAAAEVRRNAARGCRAHHVHRAADQPRPAVDPRPDRYWDPLFACVRRDRHRRLHAHRLGFEDARARPTTRPRAWASR